MTKTETLVADSEFRAQALTIPADKLAVEWQSKGYSRDQVRKAARVVRRAEPSATLSHLHPHQDCEASEAAATPQETDEQNESGRTITLNKTRIKSLDELIAHCKIDLEQWQVSNFVVNKWEVGAKNNEGKIEVEPLYQVKAWFKPKLLVRAIRAEIDDMIAGAAQWMPKMPYLPRVDVRRNKMLVLSLCDAHFGKMCWHEETGGGNYDLKIARQTYIDGIEALLQKTHAFGSFSRILYIVGNDLLNADNYEGNTTRGTRQDMDGRYPKVFRATRETITESIERLSGVADVHVAMIAGNHDYQSAFCLGDSLSSWFRNNKNVTIDNSANPTKYYEWGVNLFGMTHGDKQKLVDLPLRMAREMPDAWSRCNNYEWLTGHLHTTKEQDIQGVLVRTLPSLCPPDAWHASSGFLNSQRRAIALVYDYEEGLNGSAIHTVKG